MKVEPAGFADGLAVECEERNERWLLVICPEQLVKRQLEGCLSRWRTVGQSRFAGVTVRAQDWDLQFEGPVRQPDGCSR